MHCSSVATHYCDIFQKNRCFVSVCVKEKKKEEGMNNMEQSLISSVADGIIYSNLLIYIPTNDNLTNILK